MQSVRPSLYALRRCRQLYAFQQPRFLTRHFRSAGVVRSENGTASSVPWFVDEEHVVQRPAPRTISPLSRRADAPPVPEDAPQILKELHSQLLQSPHLDVAHLTIRQAVAPSGGPELPSRPPQGRRRRGGTYSGESSYDSLSSIWNWFVFAQVKEGTEGRGAVEAVVRLVRKTLLDRPQPITLPPKNRRQVENGWAMVDAGNFAVHIISKEAREKYFSDIIPESNSTSQNL